MHNPHERRPEALGLYDDAAQPTLSLTRLVRTLRSYSTTILGATLGVATLYIIGATIYFLLAPVARVTKLPFRLAWESASRGEYPNGTKFNITDIVGEQVLHQVFEENKLDRYTPYRTFATSVFVEESNFELDRIAAEYRARLSDARLTAVDRERINTEYGLKLASVAKSIYAVTYVCIESKCPPATVQSKVLNDILVTWARIAMMEKGVLLYRYPMLSAQSLQAIQGTRSDRLMSLLALRVRIADVLDTIHMVSRIPGAELVRTRKEQLSYADIQVRLSDLLRFRLEPLLDAVAGSSTSPQARQQLAAQLQFDQIRLAEARAEQRALTETLAAYEQREERFANDAAPPVASGVTEKKTGDSISPVLSENFLDRLIKLASDNGGIEYRQKLVEQIKDAALGTVPLEATVNYDKHLLDRVAQGGPALAPEVLDRQWNEIYASLSASINDLMEIYRLVSKQMYAEALYSNYGSTSAKEERGITIKRLFMIGIVVTALALLTAMAAAILHAQLRREETSEAEAEAEREAVHAG